VARGVVFTENCNGTARCCSSRSQQSHHAPTFHCGAPRADVIGIGVARI
jgi:hypothetical protein